jgi:hypothetical protein
MASIFRISNIMGNYVATLGVAGLGGLAQPAGMAVSTRFADPEMDLYLSREQHGDAFHDRQENQRPGN